jgi:hypothetical protein
LLATGLATADGVLTQFPRAKDGHPDLSGVWQALGTAHWNLDPHVSAYPVVLELGAQFAVPPGLGVVEGGKIPYLPAALAERDKRFENRLTDDPEGKCYLGGVPRSTYMPYPFQILQNERDVVIVYQFATGFRRIFVGGKDEAPLDTWMGWSNAHWEGDTFVVEVVGFNDKSWLQGVGTVHSEELRVIERYTRDTFDTIRYEVTIEDPVVLTKPWHMADTLRLRPNERIREYECIESNEDLVRFQELLQKESAPPPR